MLDRFLDLFVGYFDSEGFLEPSVFKVVKQNLSFKIFLEAFISFGPLALPMRWQEDPVIYLGCKMLRYGRLFEMDTQVKEILDHYGEGKSAVEIKVMEGKFDLLQFLLSIFINLHFLTCSQIILCKHGRYEESWMGA